MLSVKRIIKSVAGGLILLVLISAPGLPIVIAQSDDQQPSISSKGEGLEISPPIIEFEADPGDTVNAVVKLRNITTKNNIIAIPTVNDFVQQGETGNPQFLLDENQVSSYSIKSWVQPLTNFRLKPLQQKTIKVKINVPKNASPGGHYGTVRFTAVPEGTDVNGVSLSASLGTLLFAKINGEIKESAKTEEFSVSRNDKKGSFFEYGPLVFTERVNNTGNIHIKPVGEVVIKNIFGKQIASLKVNDKAGTILPSSIRKFEQKLDKSKLFGRYKATLSLVYGSTNQNLSQTITFWVIPYKLVLVVLLAIAVVILTWRLLRKNRRGKKSDTGQDHIKPESPENPPADNSPAGVPPEQPPASSPNQSSDNQNPPNL